MESSYLISFLYTLLRLNEDTLKFAEYKTNVNVQDNGYKIQKDED